MISAVRVVGVIEVMNADSFIGVFTVNNIEYRGIRAMSVIGVVD